MLKKAGVVAVLVSLSATTVLGKPVQDLLGQGQIPPKGLVRLAQATQSELDISTIGNPGTAPLAWVGLLNTYYEVEVMVDGKKQKKGFVANCSAQFIAPRVLLTAAHCIRLDTGETANLNGTYFLLQYQAADFSKAYRPLCAGHLADYWRAPGDTEHQKDFAMILVQEESITGHFEVQTDWWGRYSVALRTGYPTHVYNSQVIQRDPGVLFRMSDLRGFWARPDLKEAPKEIGIISSNPNIRHGSSGGAWVAIENGYPTKFLVGINSHGSFIEEAFQRHTTPKAQFFPGVVFSPYLERGPFQALFEWVSSGCPNQ